MTNDNGKLETPNDQTDKPVARDAEMEEMTDMAAPEMFQRGGTY